MINRDALISQGCVLHWPGEKAAANAPKTITAVGNATQVLPFPGAGIGMFDGNGDILTCGITSDWSFLAGGTWTVECWFYVSSYGDFTFISTYDSGTYTTLHYRCANTGKIAYGLCTPTGGWWNLNNWYGSGTYLLNAWNHVAMVRNGNDSNSTIQCFLNGVLDKTFNIGTTLLKTPTSPLVIGSYCANYPTYFNGYMSEIRVSNIAHYTTNFTPPRRQLESDEHTKLLLHFNRNDSTFIDSSPSAYTITAYGDAKQLCSPCGSGVAYFDGTGDYLSIPDSDDWNVETNVTYSAWIYPLSISAGAARQIMCQSNGTTPGNSRSPLRVFQYNSGIRVYGSSDGSNWLNSGSAIMDSGQGYLNIGWNHVEVVKSGSNFYLFINGVVRATYTNSNTWVNFTGSFYIGSYLASTDQNFYGYMSDICVIKDVALHTSDFTPSIQPFKPDPYTKLLLQFDGVGQAFYDSSDPSGDNGFLILPDDVSVTPNGTFTSVKGKDGRNYLKFDGSTNYVSIQDCDAWYFGDNKFTICCWYKSSTASVAAQIVGQLATNVTGTWSVRHGCNDTNQFGFYYNAAGTEYTIQSAIAMNDSTWRFLTVIRDGTSLKLYINNVLIITGTLVAGAFANNASALEIGRNDVDEAFCEGNIKDLMIFKKALTQDQIGAIMDETYIF